MNFIFSFLFSFAGSLTPGTINLTAVQLGLEHKTRHAWRLALAAAIMEYVYSWLAVVFEKWITSNPVVIKNFQLIAAIVMLTLGTLSLLSVSKPVPLVQRFSESGFRRGFILGVLNPLSMPYWIGVTAYLKSQHWIELNSAIQLHTYLLGVSAGVFTLLVLVAYLAKKVVTVLESRKTTLMKIPGILMIGLGIFALVRYLT
ncbi:LysE family transporter [Pollutibacter soli]|uniref:LysE family transporter n=1 Tax=Pollutibacter soli TaxID=3034157 RepID=UPI0030136542